MANTATLASLVAQALDLADLTNSSSPVTARVEDYANASLSELHDILVASFEEYLVTRAPVITLVAGTDYYTLPTDFYKALKVFSLSTSGDRVRMPRFELDEMGALSDDETDVYTDASGLRYRIIGQQIWFTPTPSSGRVELWYLPQFTKLTNVTPGTTDVVSVAVPVGWEDFVALSMAIRLLVREESDASQLMSLKEAARQRIIACAAERDAGAPRHIADVTGRFLGRA
jgi:hypothetical protein